MVASILAAFLQARLTSWLRTGIRAVDAAGKPECDILVVNPVESVWAQIYPGWAHWIESVQGSVGVGASGVVPHANWADRLLARRECRVGTRRY